MIVRDITKFDISGKKERDAVRKIKDFIESNVCLEGRILLLYGLRRTGKTTMLEQTVNCYKATRKCAFYEIEDGDSMEDVKYILSKEHEKGTEIVCLDEITKANNFIAKASFIPDVFAKYGMNVLVTGTDSLGLLFAHEDELFNRDDVVSSTHISFAEHCRVLGTDDMDNYIRYGGLMHKGLELAAIHDYKSAVRYLDSAVGNNIANSVSKCRRDNPLKSLYPTEITCIIEKMVEDYSGHFEISVMQDSLDKVVFMHPLSRAFSDIAKNTEETIETKEEKIIRMFAERINADKRVKNTVTPEMVDEFEYLLDYMHVASMINVFVFRERAGHWQRRGDTYTNHIVQPAIKYNHLVQSQKLATSGDVWAQLPDSEKDELLRQMEDKTFGDMTEQIVLFDVNAQLKGERYEVGKPVFYGKLGGLRSGEYDMLVRDKKEKLYWAFEVKHTDVVTSRQGRHLLRKDLEEAIEFQFGKKKNVAILYNGGAFQDKSGIVYLNVSDFLLSVDKNRDMEKVFFELSNGIPIHDLSIEKEVRIPRAVAQANDFELTSRKKKDAVRTSLKPKAFTAFVDGNGGPAGGRGDD